MPVRIYDIAKKLGIENKEVLSKAKELGIIAARVPSSSLDKITAEYLESHLKAAAPTLPEPPPAPPPVSEPILIVSAPASETAAAPLDVGASAPPSETFAPPPAAAGPSPLHE